MSGLEELHRRIFFRHAIASKDYGIGSKLRPILFLIGIPLVVLVVEDDQSRSGSNAIKQFGVCRNQLRVRLITPIVNDYCVVLVQPSALNIRNAQFRGGHTKEGK